MTCLKQRSGLTMWILAAGSHFNAPGRILCMADHTRFARAAGFFTHGLLLAGVRGGSTVTGEIIGGV